MSQTALLDDWLGGTPRPGTDGVDETASAGAIEMALTGRVSHGCKGAGMSDPLDVQRNLDHCMLNMKGASEAMADDMHDAAMRLGCAEMMLASASYAVHKRAAQRTQGQTQPGTGEDLGARGGEASD